MKGNEGPGGNLTICVLSVSFRGDKRIHLEGVDSYVSFDGVEADSQSFVIDQKSCVEDKSAVAAFSQFHDIHSWECFLAVYHNIKHPGARSRERCQFCQVDPNALPRYGGKDAIADTQETKQV